MMSLIIRENSKVVKVYMYNTDKKQLDTVLMDYLGFDYEKVIHENGTFKGFIRIFVNNNLIQNIKNVILADGDDIHIVFSVSGG